MVLANFMVDELAVGAFVDDDNLHGLPTYAAPVVIRARIEERTRTVRQQDGTLLHFSTWIATDNLDIGPRDRVWVPPSAGHNAPRVFPPGFVYVDADARTPQEFQRARRRAGGRGFAQFFL